MSELKEIEKIKLIKLAESAFKSSYSPYSGFKVGAAILAKSGEIYTGCNVENASYGLTMCAERSAIYTGVGKEGPEFKARAIAIATSKEGLFSPCGACRQVMLEFAIKNSDDQTIVIYQTSQGLVEKTISELIPDGFEI